ncbi:MAG TPA: tetratricopeptide repeat protein [Candidatus Binatia bacterium]|nr:tetratricopeptide repeat protein [Candidatus Binatia bacterium]
MFGSAGDGKNRRTKILSILAGLLFLSAFPTAAAPTSDEAAEAHFQRAAKYAQQGKLDEAEQEYRLGLKISPSAEAYNNLGAIYFKRRRLSEAVAVFERAHHLSPDNSEISFNLGLTLYQSGDLERAIPHLGAGAASAAHSADAHYLLGASYFGLKQWQRSISELEFARGRGAARAEILFLLVRAYRNTGKPKESLDAAAQLLRSHPDSPLVHEMLGEARDVASQPREAEDEFKAAIAASPQAPQLHFLLGYTYWRWKHYREAIAPLEEEIRINPNFAPAYFYLGDSTLKEGKPEQALDYFRKALRLDASYGEACLGMGEAYVKLGQPQDALPLFRQAAQLMPARVEPHHWLGRTLIRLGRSEEGQKELAEVERINSAAEQQATRILIPAAVPAQVGDSAHHP